MLAKMYISSNYHICLYLPNGLFEMTNPENSDFLRSLALKPAEERCLETSWTAEFSRSSTSTMHLQLAKRTPWYNICSSSKITSH